MQEHQVLTDGWKARVGPQVRIQRAARFQLGRAKARVLSGRGRAGTGLVLPEHSADADQGSSAQRGRGLLLGQAGSG